MGKKRGASHNVIAPVLPRVIGDPPLYGLSYPKSRIRQFAEANKRNPTNAERRFRHILMRLNRGVSATALPYATRCQRQMDCGFLLSRGAVGNRA